jgi:leucyl-tRNA synthetase
MEYNHSEIEKRWQKEWADKKTFAAQENSKKPKFYSLDMFPYPSGAGLHVGHPLGYIASDIYSRYKRLTGYNVLHPMGYDSFGLPAEQYAIQTGQHPAVTTKTNVERYRQQMDQIGFSFDWDREVRTSSPEYYKWTQWIFKQIFDSWYNKATNKAEKIETLIAVFESEGNATVKAACSETKFFTADQWSKFTEKGQSDILMNYRLAFISDSMVNWCPALGTVLANDEIKDGVSERGGHPVVQKLMRQWSMRITAYADRLIQGLDTIDWSDSIKEQQKNWIGKSKGASLFFDVENSDKKIEVFTTRPDTIFGVNFMVLAPEHELVAEITTADQKQAIEDYIHQASLKTERDRQADVKNITGVNTGAFAIHPFTGDKVQIWIGDYVLAGYGTGAVMAVPAGDQRDWSFANHFGVEIKNIFENVDISEAACEDKSAILTNSDFLNGLNAKKGIGAAIKAIQDKGCGKGMTNFRLRDAIFSRQRYWGEPFPVYFENEIPKTIEDEFLPIELPEVEKYLPTEDGDPPLGNANTWSWCRNEKILKTNDKQNGSCTWPMELNTMPGWAGSSWYFLRYMDANNPNEFVSKEKADYWGQVDLYIGGAEHATGHLLYSRFWTKFLYDRNYISFEEPFKKLINQGMILGRSSFVNLVHMNSTFGSDEITDEEIDSIPKEITASVYVSNDLINTDERGLNSLNEFAQDKLKTIISERNKNLKTIFSSRIIGLDTDPNEALVYSNHADISFVNNDKLDLEAFKNWREEYKDAEFITNENGEYICGSEVEKMSKSKYNVQTPDELVEKFGADTLRCYEMFLGPLEQAKPWDTNGISGVNGFLKKLWRLFHQGETFTVTEGEADKKSLKTLHTAIKKITEDLERYSFNTIVSNLMICVNELQAQKCNNKEVLSELLVLASPYAPHICEELWNKLGNSESISFAAWPLFNPEFLLEANHNYPVSFNGKMRFMLELPSTMQKDDIEKAVMAHEKTAGYLDGKAPKKVIIVPKKIVNIVI